MVFINDCLADDTTYRWKFHNQCFQLSCPKPINFAILLNCNNTYFNYYEVSTMSKKKKRKKSLLSVQAKNKPKLSRKVVKASYFITRGVKSQKNFTEVKSARFWYMWLFASTLKRYHTDTETKTHNTVRDQ